MCAFLLNNGVVIYAHADSDSTLESEVIGDLTNENDDEIFALTSSGGTDFSGTIDNLTTYFDSAYPDFTWYQDNCNSTKDVSSAIPINMQGINFPKSEIQQAIINTGVASSYGGCGPIAMMGILDYFARYLGYNEIMEDPTDSHHRVQLAEDVLNTVKTYEVGLIGDKSTLSFPWDYVSAFNKLMRQYGLEDNISAEYKNTVLGNNRDEFMQIIEEYVHKGIPVTMYMDKSAGKGGFAGHYVNIYAYEKWHGYHNTTEERIDKTFLKARLNFVPKKNPNEVDPDKENYDLDKYYADSNILNNTLCGIIYYNVNYDNNKLVVASDFASQFINTETGQGQYFGEEKSATITSASGYTFNTNRLRCSYIENQYLVLSANKKGAGEACLEFSFLNDVKKMNFDMSLWSAFEKINDGTLTIQIPKVAFDGNIIWTDYIIYDIKDLSVQKLNPKNYTVLFPAHVSRFRFKVTAKTPEGKRNKGRVVLDNITFSFDKEDSSHVHNWNIYKIDDRNHYQMCECGHESIGLHVIKASDSFGRYARCIICNKKIDLDKDIVVVQPDSLRGLMRTINGSYINQQGIIVLVDEDIDSYLNGTLVFYYEDDIPLIE